MNLTDQITAAVQYAEAEWAIDVEPISAGTVAGVPWVCVDTGEATPYIVLESPTRAVPTPIGLGELTVEWQAEALTAAGPEQIRAAKGSAGGIGGQWIDTPAGLRARLSPTGPYENELSAALGEPGAPRTYQEMSVDPTALVAEVNPGRMDRLNGEDFRYNCQRTVMATEMRARGYDVVAPGASGNDGTLWEVQHKWILPTPNPDGSNVPQWSEKGNGYDDAMIGGPGNVGKRFIMAGAFPGFGGMAGHVWNAEVRADGEVIHLDAQGSVLKDLGIDIDKMTDVQWMRVDNAAPTEDMWRMPDYDADPYAPPAWIMTSKDFAEDYEMQYERPLSAAAEPIGSGSGWPEMVYNDCVPTVDGWLYVGDLVDDEAGRTP